MKRTLLPSFAALLAAVTVNVVIVRSIAEYALPPTAGVVISETVASAR